MKNAKKYTHFFVIIKYISIFVQEMSNILQIIINYGNRTF